jgi:hypothetical protein
MIFHFVCMLYIYQSDFSINSIVVSELLILFIWIWFVGVIKNGTKQSDHSKAVQIGGVIGRGYTVILLVVCITDAMTLGGWLATCVLWQVPNSSWLILMVLWAARFVLWGLSLCVTCHVLYAMDELQTDQGIWFHLLGWSVIEPCCPVGQALLEQRWIISRPSSSFAAQQGFPSATVRDAGHNKNHVGRLVASRLLLNPSPPKEPITLDETGVNAVSDIL